MTVQNVLSSGDEFPETLLNTNELALIQFLIAADLTSSDPTFVEKLTKAFDPWMHEAFERIETDQARRDCIAAGTHMKTLARTNNFDTGFCSICNWRG